MTNSEAACSVDLPVEHDQRLGGDQRADRRADLADRVIAGRQFLDVVSPPDARQQFREGRIVDVQPEHAAGEFGVGAGERRGERGFADAGRAVDQNRLVFLQLRINPREDHVPPDQLARRQHHRQGMWPRGLVLRERSNPPSSFSIICRLESALNNYPQYNLEGDLWVI